MAGTFEFEEAAVGILSAVAYADGRISDEEQAWWHRVQYRHPLFADLPPSIFNPMLDRARQTLTDTPWPQAVAAWAAADRKSTRLNSSHIQKSRMPSSA